MIPAARKIEIAKINGTFTVRKINQTYIDHLVKDFENNGFQNAYPVSITDDGVLWDGSHRVTAARKAGILEVPYIIETPENIRRAAHERNRVATNALPETFVDHAEEIWAMLAGGMTQQAVADDIGWSLSKVKQYAQLEKISHVAWNEIVTEFQENVTISGDDGVTKKVTPVTENLLRNILPLTEHHQLKIITGLIAGETKPGQVKNLCAVLSGRESFIEYATDALLSKKEAPVFFKDCLDGLYATMGQVEKAVKHANDEFEKTNSIRVFAGDCLDVLKTEIKNLSCDALITDPPYNILSDEWDTFKNKESFLSFSKEWMALATSKIKSTGRLYIFWSQEFMFDFPFDAIPERFIFGNMLIWNYKNNTKPNNQKIYKHTYEPCFYFYGADAGILNLPKNAEWDEDMNSYDLFEYAQPQSNFTDKKTHPAQKPEKLMIQLVTLGSDVGDTVLDCFAGSGTTGLACKKLKRKAVLIEKNQDYLKAINLRISNE